MRARQNLNYLCKLERYGKSEIALGIDPENRIYSFLGTKTPVEQQEAKDKLMQILQEPPIKKFDETDEEYIARYRQWENKTQHYEKLIYYIK